MLILTQFIFRLSFGLALAMTLTPARTVTSGYYRNNLYVLLGASVLASLIAGSGSVTPPIPWWPPVSAAVLSYVGSVVWLYERPRTGKVILSLIAATTLAGAWLTLPPRASAGAVAEALYWLDPVAGGLILGTTTAGMLLGHWYLNAPGMPLAPLVRLVAILALAVTARALLCGVGLVLEVSEGGSFDIVQRMLLLIRWLAGVFGLLVLIVMSRQTLKIPNTQSTTGLLYVAVLAGFVGELAAQLLSVESLYPL